LGGSHTFFDDLGHSGNLVSLFPLFLQNLSVITGLNSKSYLGIILLFLLVTISFKRLSILSRFLVFQLFFQFLILLIFIFLSQEYLPFRAVIYLNALFSICLLLVIYDLIQSFNLKWYPSLIIICLLLISHTFYLYKNTWLKQCTHFIFDRSSYNELENSITKISTETPQSIFVQKGNNYYLFYLQLYLGKEVQITEDPSFKNSSDIIISSDSMSYHKLLFYDDSNEIFVYLNRT